MAWPLSLKSKKSKRAYQRRTNRSNLRVESLESRRVLAGMVDIFTSPGGQLRIVGDSNANNVAVVSTPVPGNPGQLTISAGDAAGAVPTQFTVNGVPASVQPGPIVVNPPLGTGFFNDINVDLAGAADTLTFGSAASPVNVLRNVNILNEGTGDTNNLTNTNIFGSLSIEDGVVVLPGAFTPGIPAARPNGVPARAALPATGVVNNLTNVAVTNNVVVNNGGGGTTNITNPTPAAGLFDVGGGVFVSSATGSTTGVNTLTITGTRVQGVTMVTNATSGTSTTVTNATLNGAATVALVAPGTVAGGVALPAAVPAIPATQSGVGLMVTNDTVGGSIGFDNLKILGTTTIGAGSFPILPAAQPFSHNALIVNNGVGGGSSTVLAQAPGVGGATPVGNGPNIRGGAIIDNGAGAITGKQDLLAMINTQVAGSTIVYNGAGTTNTTIAGSWLGSAPTPPGVGLGNPFVMINDAGADVFVMDNTTVPWGVYVNHDDAGAGASVFTQLTAITGSQSGATNPLTGQPSQIATFAPIFGPGGVNLNTAITAIPSMPALTALPFLVTQGEGLFVAGGGGNDVVNIGQNLSAAAPGQTVTLPGGALTPANTPSAVIPNPVPLDATMPFGPGAQVTVINGFDAVPAFNNSVTIQGGFGATPGSQSIARLVVLGSNGNDTLTLQNVRVTAQLIIDFSGVNPVNGGLGLGLGVDTVNIDLLGTGPTLNSVPAFNPLLAGTAFTTLFVRADAVPPASAANDVLNDPGGILAAAFSLGGGLLPTFP